MKQQDPSAHRSAHGAVIGLLFSIMVGMLGLVFAVGLIAAFF